MYKHTDTGNGTKKRRYINSENKAKTYQPAASGSDNETLIQLCVDKLRILIEDNDQNLKYLGLLSMIRILGKACCYRFVLAAKRSARQKLL